MFTCCKKKEKKRKKETKIKQNKANLHPVNFSLIVKNNTVKPGYKRVVGTGEEVYYILVSLISGFGLFCLGNTGSNLGPEKISLIS